MQRVHLSNNNLAGGVLWLRLVNTTLSNVNITHNVCGATDASPSTQSVVEALLRLAVLQVHAPAAFDMQE
jgi:hypothetical protein